MEGWVKLYRKIKESSFYHDSNLVHLWLHIMLSANKFEQNYLWHGEEIVIQPGQFITGRKKLSAETGIQESKIQRALKMFEKMKMIEQQTNSKSRMITVINWNMHQENEQQMNNKRTTTEQQVNTNKKEKKEKKGKNKNKTNPPDIKIFLESMSDSLKEFCRVENIGQLKFKKLSEMCFDHFKGKGELKADWEATVRNWIRRDKTFNNNNSEQSRPVRSTVVD